MRQARSEYVWIKVPAGKGPAGDAQSRWAATDVPLKRADGDLRQQAEPHLARGDNTPMSFFERTQALAPRWATGLAAAVILSTSTAPSPHGQSLSLDRADWADRVDSLVETELRRGGVVGAAVVVEHRGELLVAKGYGVADLEHSTPLNIEGIFRIGSLAQQVTAVAVLQLVEQGKLALDDPLTRYLPAYPSQGRRVTIHHLLTHTSAIANDTSLPRFRTARLQDLTDEEMLELFAREPFRFAPGDRWQYSNSGYYLLGMIVEDVSGETFADYVEEHILRPLGMTRSSYCAPEMLRKIVSATESTLIRPQA